MLPCSHEFCIICLMTMIEHEEYKCPICRLPWKGKLIYAGAGKWWSLTGELEKFIIGIIYRVSNKNVPSYCIYHISSSN